VLLFRVTQLRVSLVLTCWETLRSSHWLYYRPVSMSVYLCIYYAYKFKFITTPDSNWTGSVDQPFWQLKCSRKFSNSPPSQQNMSFICRQSMSMELSLSSNVKATTIETLNSIIFKNEYSRVCFSHCPLLPLWSSGVPNVSQKQSTVLQHFRWQRYKAYYCCNLQVGQIS
jgi:hypothetical protein